MRAVFFGTPAIATPALAALYEVAEIAGVVCQPDRPSGRGLKKGFSPIKQFALARGLEVHQPTRLRDGTLAEWLRQRHVDVALVLAYGRILPKDVLSAPKHGCLNLHASLLPRYRGAAPIQWALSRGETQTGISLMQMDEGLDTGPVYTRRTLEIMPEENAGELTERLSLLAADVVREDLHRVLRGDLPSQPQDDREATLAPPIRAEQQLLDWTDAAISLSNWVRALAPRPGARTSVRGKNLKILKARAVQQTVSDTKGGVRIRPPQDIFVQTGRGSLAVLSGQLEGKRACSARDLINGRVLLQGDLLTRPTLSH